jgi:hypothetical protein
MFHQLQQKKEEERPIGVVSARIKSLKLYKEEKLLLCNYSPTRLIIPCSI